MNGDDKLKQETVKFSLWLATCVTLGFLYTTFGAVVVDSQIDLKLRPKTLYPWEWLVPIAILLFPLTCFLFHRSTDKGHRLLAAVGPLAAAYVLSFPIFRPEMPHVGVAWIGAVWMFLIASWMMIRSWAFQPAGGRPEQYDAAALIQHTKEELEFSRYFLIGFLAAYIALMVSSQSFIRDNSLLIAKDEKSAIILDGKFSLDLVVFSVMLTFGPVLEILKKRAALLGVFLSIAPRAESSGK